MYILQRIVRFTIVLTVCLIAAVVLFFGCNCTLLVYGAWDNTEYAAKYNWMTFRQIGAGDTKDSVSNRLGNPLKVQTFDSERNAEYWYYSAPKIHRSWFVRSVVFDSKTSTVTSRKSEIYWD